MPTRKSCTRGRFGVHVSSSFGGWRGGVCSFANKDVRSGRWEGDACVQSGPGATANTYIASTACLTAESHKDDPSGGETQPISIPVQSNNRSKLHMETHPNVLIYFCASKQVVVFVDACIPSYISCCIRTLHRTRMIQPDSPSPLHQRLCRSPGRAPGPSSSTRNRDEAKGISSTPAGRDRVHHGRDRAHASVSALIRGCSHTGWA